MPFGFEHEGKWNFINIFNCKLPNLAKHSFANMNSRHVNFKHMTLATEIKSGAFEVMLNLSNK